MLRTLNAKPHVAKASTSCFYLECLYAGTIYSTIKTPLSNETQYICYHSQGLGGKSGTDLGFLLGSFLLVLLGLLFLWFL